MKISLTWLQKYFDEPLPKAEAIADAYTFHAFEIEEVVGDMMDVKVLPNRAADCLCHRGLAKELSAILDVPIKTDPLRTSLPAFKKTDALSVEIEDRAKCLRYMGALMKGVKVGPSPTWLKEALEAVGQRSINNIVDATNYVMLDAGQPLHAFDASKLAQKDGNYSIKVRDAKKGEKMTTLSGEELTLSPGVLLITDANTDVAIGIAGVKGGKLAEVTVATTDLIIESANFDGTTIRHAAQSLKLFTDASQRFQNRPSPELTAYGIRDVLVLIKEVAGGEIIGVVDEHPARPEKGQAVSVTLAKINGILGSNFSKKEVEEVFKRLDLDMKIEGDTFSVTPPFERTDLTIPEDLIEEVGRILGYDRVPADELPPISGMPDQARYHGIERMKDQLVEQGFIEVSTPSFAKKGDITLANPLDKAKPAMRTSLEENLKDALTRAKYNAPLVLLPGENPKLFEVGTVFPKEGEYLELRTVPSVASAEEGDLSKIELEDYGKDYVPRQYTLSAFKPFSIYPFITRDIALWIPTNSDTELAESLIDEHAGPLLVHLNPFDRFEKEGRVSLAFRLVFQSFERTLTEVEVNEIMEKIYTALRVQGFEIR